MGSRSQLVHSVLVDAIIFIKYLSLIDNDNFRKL